MKYLFILLMLAAFVYPIDEPPMSDEEAQRQADEIFANWDGTTKLSFAYEDKAVYDKLRDKGCVNIELCDASGNEYLVSKISSGVKQAEQYYSKAKKWAREHIPAWQEIGFLVNAVAVYQKIYDNYQNFMYQVRLIQQTIHLVERQYYWIQRTSEMIDKMGQRGCTLADIEQTFRDASYLSGPHYRYLCFMTGRTMQNMENFNAAFSKYSWEDKKEKSYAVYSVYLGNPAIRGAMYLDPDDKRPLIMKANLSAATEADNLIASFNDNLASIVKQKKDLNDSVTESSQEATVNQCKTYQMIVLANVLRARSKLYTIDAIKARNRLIALRIMSYSHRKREDIFNKYKQTVYYK